MEEFTAKNKEAEDAFNEKMSQHFSLKEDFSNNMGSTDDLIWDFAFAKLDFDLGRQDSAIFFFSEDGIILYYANAGTGTINNEITEDEVLKILAEVDAL